MALTIAVNVEICVLLQLGRTCVLFQQHLTDLPWTRDHQTCGISHSTGACQNVGRPLCWTSQFQTRRWVRIPPDT